MQYLPYYDCFYFIRHVHSYYRFILITTIVKISFISKANWYSIICADPILFIHSSAEGHVDCFHCATMNMGLQVSVQVPLPSSFGHTPRNGIAGSYSDFYAKLF